MDVVVVTVVVDAFVMEVVVTGVLGARGPTKVVDDVDPVFVVSVGNVSD